MSAIAERDFATAEWAEESLTVRHILNQQRIVALRQVPDARHCGGMHEEIKYKASIEKERVSARSAMEDAVDGTRSGEGPRRSKIFAREARRGSFVSGA